MSDQQSRSDQTVGADQQNWPGKGQGLQYLGSAPPLGTFTQKRTSPIEWLGSWFVFTGLVILGIIAGHFWTPALFVFGALLVVWFGLWIARVVHERREFNASYVPTKPLSEYTKS